MSPPRAEVKTLPAGDMLALQELCDFPAAFSQADECGWYPLHRAAVQPLALVLETVLYGGYEVRYEANRAASGDAGDKISKTMIKCC